ncbi:MAG: HAMP domain-containing protein [Spirochaetales bacterium]|nr:HAMP domain-containing protein [Spirochaetales bacterium]
MKGKLWIKIFLSFSSVIIISGALIMGIITFSISNQFEVFVKNGDVVAARGLAPFLEGYLEMSGDWDGVMNYLPRQTMRNGERGRAMGMMDRRMGTADIDMGRRIIITELSGHVIVDSEGELTGLKLDNISETEGIIIFNGDTPAALLFLDTMIEPALNPLGEAFISGVRRAVVSAVIPALILALVVTLFIVRHITLPLVSMKSAAEKIALGDFSIRTGVKRQDELGDLASTFDDMAASLETGEEWKKQIIADSAHELRTPVALIQGTLEMMSDGVYPLEPDRIKSLYEETQHLSDLIAGLQELAGLQAETDRWEKSEVDLKSMAEDVAESFVPVLRDKKATLNISGDSPFLVKGNSSRLKQVFINLYANASRYIPEKGIIDVTFRDLTASGEVEVSISNDGPPIPVNELEKIFERFYRVEKSRNRDEGGRGLGLAICSEIIKAHGGKISAENLPNKSGVKFAFTMHSLL